MLALSLSSIQGQPRSLPSGGAWLVPLWLARARSCGWDRCPQYSQPGPSLPNQGVPLTGGQSWLSGQAAVRPGKCQPLRADVTSGRGEMYLKYSTRLTLEITCGEGNRLT